MIHVVDIILKNGCSIFLLKKAILFILIGKRRFFYTIHLFHCRQAASFEVKHLLLKLNEMIVSKEKKKVITFIVFLNTLTVTVATHGMFQISL